MHIISLLFTAFICLAQTPPASSNGQSPGEVTSGNVQRADRMVSITEKPKTDKEIKDRITKILNLTGWFNSLEVSCVDGVVTLSGVVAGDSQRDWAVKLAQDTAGVVAVINKVDLKKTPWFDLNPTKNEVKSLLKNGLAFLPHMVIALVIFALSLLAYFRLSGYTQAFWSRRITNPLLSDLMSRIGALPFLLVGLYLVLQVLNLTGLAMTLLGGTGAMGLVAGFAFKNILENYFSGIMLSVRRPFIIGDVIEVSGETGIVYGLSTRGTTLVDFNGNHIFIPNSTIITSIIKNHTASPHTRIHLTFELVPGDEPEKQRKRIMDYLKTRDEILNNPKPEARIVDAKVEVYFWINVRKTSADKLKLLVDSDIREVMSGAPPPPKTRKSEDTRPDTKDILAQVKDDKTKPPGPRPPGGDVREF